MKLVLLSFFLAVFTLISFKNMKKIKEDTNNTLFVLYHSPGEKWNHQLKSAEQNGIVDHVNYMASFIESNQLVLGGGFQDDSTGMMILNLQSIDDATEIAFKDPAVIKGLLTVKFKEWNAILRSPNLMQTQIEENNNLGRVKAIGGVFFKSKNPTELKKWYKEHLGIDTDDYGTNFEWRDSNNPKEKGFTQWSPFVQNTKYFYPSEKEFMINYRVDNLEALLSKLKISGIKPIDEINEYDYGKFVHILDIENNKIELWEPIDDAYDKLVEGRTN